MQRRGAGKRDDAGLIDGLDERRRAAVHDRDFRAVNLDNRVIDAEPVQCRQDMFGGGDRRAVLVAEHGGEFGCRDRTIIGAKFAVPAAIHAGAAEHDAAAGFGRMKRDGDRGTGMNAYAGDGDLLAQGSLPAGVHAPRHALVPDLMAGLPQQSDQSQPKDAKVGAQGTVSAQIASPWIPMLSPDAAVPLTNKPYRRPRILANSRFLTDCYLFPAALVATAAATAADGAARTAGRAERIPGDRSRGGNPANSIA